MLVFTAIAAALHATRHDLLKKSHSGSSAAMTSAGEPAEASLAPPAQRPRSSRSCTILVVVLFIGCSSVFYHSRNQVFIILPIFSKAGRLRKGLALPRTSHSGEIASAGAYRLCASLAAAPVH